MLTLKTPRITVLVQCFDADGVMRFPSDEHGYFGLTRSVDQTLAVSKQAQRTAATALGKPEFADKIEPIITVEPVLRAPELEPSLLYLMRSDAGLFKADPSWLRIVDILRRLPQGSVRVAYNKAMQVFAGALEEQVSVIEIDDAVRLRLHQLMAAEDFPL